MHQIKHNTSFEYPEVDRISTPNGRFYLDPQSKQHLVSVTTILSQTGDKSGLDAWRKWVGQKAAKQITREAADLGTVVHSHLEAFIKNKERPKGGNLIYLMARKMSDEIINRGLNDVSEIWGIEKRLYFPGLYAGTADLIGIYRGAPALMDFKSAKKLKKEEWMQDYYCQLVAYSLAHNELFGTDINTGIIFMVDRDYNYKRYIIEGDDFKKYCDIWLNRVEEWYNTHRAPGE